jgi:F0F1-type ATP synthase epsilon subunit
MSTKTFQFRLITPLGKLIDAPATSANVPAHDGMLGFLADRAAIVTTLGAGPLQVTLAPGGKDGVTGPRLYYVEDGFVQMVNNKLTVLTNKAIASEELVESDARAELTAAEARKPSKPEEVAAISKAQDAARAKLRTAQKVSGKGI